MQVTICPPSSSGFENFDSHQFADKKSLAVHAQFAGRDEWKSTHLDFADYTRCQTITKRLAPSRRFATPSWALSGDLALVITVYLERRAFSKRERGRINTELPLSVRLKAACERLRARIPARELTLGRACKAYMELKNLP
jgi:hypothetical protein